MLCSNSDGSSMDIIAIWSHGKKLKLGSVIEVGYNPLLEKSMKSRTMQIMKEIDEETFDEWWAAHGASTEAITKKSRTRAMYFYFVRATA